MNNTPTVVNPREEMELLIEHQNNESVARSEFDAQITTAKRYPRSVTKFINEAKTLVMLNESRAAGCIYAIPRAGKMIEGASVRFSEIILHCWGNTTAGYRIVRVDDKSVTAQGICHDLEKNVKLSVEVARNITYSTGQRYSEDMIITTGNAAGSIALRQAILRIVPKAFWDDIYEEARKVVMGNSKTLNSRKSEALVFLRKFGATPEMIFKKLQINGEAEITLDHLVILRGIATAIKDGDSTLERIFEEELKEIKNKNLPPLAVPPETEKKNEKQKGFSIKIGGEIITKLSIKEAGEYLLQRIMELTDSSAREEIRRANQEIIDELHQADLIDLALEIVNPNSTEENNNE